MRLAQDDTLLLYFIIKEPKLLKIPLPGCLLCSMDMTLLNQQKLMIIHKKM